MVESGALLGSPGREVAKELVNIVGYVVEEHLMQEYALQDQEVIDLQDLGHGRLNGL